MSSAQPYDRDARSLDGDLIDPDDPGLDDIDEPFQSHSDRAPLTGNIEPDAYRNPISQNQGYLTSQIPGEDRRAPQNTLDESVWATLSRDLTAVWEKMRLVLYPKHLFGGVMHRGEGIGAAERGEAEGLSTSNIRNLVGRWPVDADTLLQGGMSEGLRDWDLWGPLLFCLLLSLFLSIRAGEDQKSLVFSGVFAIVWIGEAVVTIQIKLLGGVISFFQSVCIIGYTLFPLVIASLLSVFRLHMAIKAPVYAVLVLWSLAAGVSILGGSGVVKNRVSLAVFPLFMYYISLGCLCLIST